MTIDEVYRLVQTFANKEQRGFITPSEFNLLAKQAEIELYNKRLSIVTEKSQPKKLAGYYKESLAPELAEQDISGFLKTDPIILSVADVPDAGADKQINADYIKSIHLMPSRENSISTNIPVEIVSQDDANQIRRSNLAAPSFEYPIALISQYSTNTSSKKLSIFPDTITKIRVWRYYYENNPTWGYVTIAGKPVYDASSSNQFTISPRCHGEMVIKILEYLGVTIREADVVQYSTNKEVKADS